MTDLPFLQLFFNHWFCFSELIDKVLYNMFTLCRRSSFPRRASLICLYKALCYCGLISAALDILLFMSTHSLCGSPGVHAMLQGYASSGESWADHSIWDAPWFLGLLQVSGWPKSSSHLFEMEGQYCASEVWEQWLGSESSWRIISFQIVEYICKEVSAFLEAELRL